MADNINSPYRTRAEAAEYFRRSEQTIDRWVKQRLLETKKIGRARLITLESMQALEEQGAA